MRIRYAAVSVFFTLALGLFPTPNGLAHAQDKQPPSDPKARPARPPAQWLDPNRDEPNGTKYRTFPSKLAGSEVSYLIYLPPDYEKQSQRYPVIYWLHGLGGNQRAGATAFVPQIDSVIKQGFLPPAIVVSVNGMVNSFYNDSIIINRPVESVIIKELIPHVDQTYRTIAQREGRAIEGFSMGGYGSAHLGFKYPELFGTVVVTAGALIQIDDPHNGGAMFKDVFGDDKDRFLVEHPFQLVVQNADKIRSKTHVRIGCGAKDDVLIECYDLHKRLNEMKIEHQFEVVPDMAHEAARYYKTLGTRAFEIYRRAFADLPPNKKVSELPAERQEPKRPDPREARTPIGKVPPGFTPIFNGKDLAGWQGSKVYRQGNSQEWTVRDGALFITQDKPGNGGLLLTDRKYKDFELYLEVNLDFGCDGGLFLRSNEKGQAYQVMLDYLPKRKPGLDLPLGIIGGVYGEDLQGVSPELPKGWEKVWRENDWNALRVRVEGKAPHISVWLNDTKITDWTDSDNHAADGAEEGHIALQVHGGKGGWAEGKFHRFRNVAIKELKK